MWLHNQLDSILVSPSLRFSSFPEILKRPQKQSFSMKKQEELQSSQVESPEPRLQKVRLKPRLPTLTNLKHQSKPSNLSPTNSQHQLKPPIPKFRNDSNTKPEIKSLPNEDSQKPIIKEPAKLLFKQAVVIDQYEVREVIGQGSYATVRKAVHQITGEQVAIKMYSKERLFDPSRARSVAKEISILRGLCHRNVIKLYKVVESKKYVNLILEYGGERSLKQLKHLQLEEVQNIFYQIMSAVKYIHDRNIIHRDIKLDNILINDQRYSSVAKREVKLIDFGFATELTSSLSVTYGTPSYMSPEMLTPAASYNEKTDIWSSGVVLYVLLYNKFPFSGNNEKDLQNKIRRQDFIIPESNVYISEVLKSCLERDPEKRKSADSLLKTVWLSFYE